MLLKKGSPEHFCFAYTAKRSISAIAGLLFHLHALMAGLCQSLFAAGILRFTPVKNCSVLRLKLCKKPVWHALARRLTVLSPLHFSALIFASCAYGSFPSASANRIPASKTLCLSQAVAIFRQKKKQQTQSESAARHPEYGLKTSRFSILADRFSPLLGFQKGKDGP